jgi:PST family polysaccharide transporter
MAAEPERESQWLGALVLVRTTIALVVMFACAISIPLVLTDAHETHEVALILTLTMLATGPAAFTSVFQSRLRAGLQFSFTVVLGAAWTATVIVLYIAHASVVVFAATDTVLILAIAVLQVFATRRFARIDWSGGRRLWRRLMRMAIPLGVANVMITIYWQVDSVLLLQISGPHESGIYGAAYGFLSPLTFFPAAIMGSFFPVLSAVYGSDPGRARQLIQIAGNTMAVIALPVLAGTIALSEPIIHLIYGPGFHRSAEILPILMIAFVAICFGTLAGFLAPLLELRWRFALFTSIGAIGNVILNFALIPSYGAFGSAWATVATEVLTMALMMFTGLKKLRLRPRVGRIARTVLLAAAMTGVMAACAPLGLIPAGLIGVAFYALGLFLLRIINADEIRLVLRRAQAVPAPAEQHPTIAG